MLLHKPERYNTSEYPQLTVSRFFQTFTFAAAFYL